MLPKNFYKSLAAVLVGNAIYFLLLMPILPPIARHARLSSHGMPHFDLGLVVDFWVCVVAYGAIELFWRKRKPSDVTKGP
jgi:hypothetical protein